MSIKITGLDAAKAQISKATFDRLALPVCVAVATEAQTWISTYPPARHGKQPFKTAKQRRGFFAKLRSGAIQVPYRRGTSPGSQQLGRKWRIIPQGKGCLLTNSASYAALVHAAAEQSAYHKATGWRTDEAVKAYIEGSDVARVAAEQIVRNTLGV